MCERIFRAQVDIAFAGTDGETGNRHTLDKPERVAFHEDAIRERATVTFIGIARDVLLLARRISHGAPLDARRKAGAASAT